MINDQVPMTNQPIAESSRRPFDLAERTATFGEHIIRFSRTIRREAVTVPLINQLVRSATSVGANYVEADEAGSKKEFSYRISVCRREARETQYWLRMIVAAQPEMKEHARALWREAKELAFILSAIHRKSILPAK
jgi:four helix bundle protein